MPREIHALSVENRCVILLRKSGALCREHPPAPGYRDQAGPACCLPVLTLVYGDPGHGIDRPSVLRRLQHLRQSSNEEIRITISQVHGRCHAHGIRGQSSLRIAMEGDDIPRWQDGLFNREAKCWVRQPKRDKGQHEGPTATEPARIQAFTR